MSLRLFCCFKLGFPTRDAASQQGRRCGIKDAPWGCAVVRALHVHVSSRALRRPFLSCPAIAHVPLLVTVENDRARKQEG